MKKPVFPFNKEFTGFLCGARISVLLKRYNRRNQYPLLTIETIRPPLDKKGAVQIYESEYQTV